MTISRTAPRILVREVSFSRHKHPESYSVETFAGNCLQVGQCRSLLRHVSEDLPSNLSQLIVRGWISLPHSLLNVSATPRHHSYSSSTLPIAFHLVSLPRFPEIPPRFVFPHHRVEPFASFAWSHHFLIYYLRTRAVVLYAIPGHENPPSSQNSSLVVCSF